MATQAPTNYDAQREKLAEYFDRTARKAWIDLTSDAKVSGIRRCAPGASGCVKPF